MKEKNLVLQDRDTGSEVPGSGQPEYFPEHKQVELLQTKKRNQGSVHFHEVRNKAFVIIKV